MSNLREHFPDIDTPEACLKCPIASAIAKRLVDDPELAAKLAKGEDVSVTPDEPKVYRAMQNSFNEVGLATEAYAAYLNANPEAYDDPDDREQFDADLALARAAMERAWLEAKPVKRPT